MTGAAPFTPNDLALDTRSGWPDDLRVLLERYPREVWPNHANLGMMAQFWLQRHDMFRELGGALQEATTQFRDGKVPAANYQTWFAPRLQFFLSQLHSHHYVEDAHYFPAFSAAEQRLARGFAVLERDHEHIAEGLHASVEVANTFLQAMGSDGDALRRAGDRYVEVNGHLLDQLLRHLRDEEDLIVPLILDRGEQALGVY